LLFVSNFNSRLLKNEVQCSTVDVSYTGLGQRQFFCLEMLCIHYTNIIKLSHNGDIIPAHTSSCLLSEANVRILIEFYVQRMHKI
jgi:hypothetical protein